MDTYSPKPWHLFIPAFFFIGGTPCFVTPEWVKLGMAFYGLGSGLTLWILIAGLWETKRTYNDSLADVARAIAQLDPSRWSALGIKFPELRIRFQGEPVTYFEDTDILHKCLVQFLEDSDDVSFAAERLYNDTDQIRDMLGLTREQVREQWRMAVEFLTVQKHLIENSASGNRTYLWRTGRRQMLMDKYVRSMLKIEELP
jgi:hypothetical protein